MLTPQPIARQRLVMVVSSLATGGGERSAVVLANHWATSGREVTLITMDGAADRTILKVDPAVNLMRLGIRRRKPIQGLSLLRGTLMNCRPDVIVSFLDKAYIATLAASLFLRVPVIISERVAPRFAPTGWPWRVARRILFRRANAVVAVSRGVLAEVGVHEGQVAAVIPGPVTLDVSVPRAPIESREKVITAMGRLVPQKGFDILLEVIANIAPRLSGWKVEVWGEGAERGSLESRKIALGLDGLVEFKGETDIPQEVLSRSRIFVLSSRFEGYPRVLAEAMMLGNAVVSFDCPHGPSEMIRHQESGLLVPQGDAQGLGDALLEVCENLTLQQTLSRNATSVAAQCSLEYGALLWDEVLSKAIASAHGRVGIQ